MLCCKEQGKGDSGHLGTSKTGGFCRLSIFSPDHAADLMVGVKGDNWHKSWALYHILNATVALMFWSLHALECLALFFFVTRTKAYTHMDDLTTPLDTAFTKFMSATLYPSRKFGLTCCSRIAAILDVNRSRCIVNSNCAFLPPCSTSLLVGPKVFGAIFNARSPYLLWQQCSQA